MTETNQLSFDFISNNVNVGKHEQHSPLTVGDKEDSLGFGLSEEHGANIPNITRPIHYLGSKLRLLDEICQALDKAEPKRGPVIDLFAGSGTVSMALSRVRKVVAIDIQEYSRVLCSAMLNPTRLSIQEAYDLLETAENHMHERGIWEIFQPIVMVEAEVRDEAIRGNLKPLCDFLEHCSLIGYERQEESATNSRLRDALKEVQSRIKNSEILTKSEIMVTRHFGGLYFSFEQAVRIDAILEIISRSAEEKKDTLLACLLSTASETVNTVGKQFAQPLRPRNSEGLPKPNLSGQVERDRTIDIFSTYKKWMARYVAIHDPLYEHKIARMDYRDALAKYGQETSIIYVDPPYTRDHYSRFYHVLETISLRDDPGVTTRRIRGKTRITRGLYREERHQSDFCIKSKAPLAFKELFRIVKDLEIPLVLSYSPYDSNRGGRSRLLTMDQVTEIAEQYFKYVEVDYPKLLSHSKLNSIDKNYESLDYGEALITCRN